MFTALNYYFLLRRAKFFCLRSYLKIVWNNIKKKSNRFDPIKKFNHNTSALFFYNCELHDSIFIPIRTGLKKRARKTIGDLVKGIKRKISTLFEPTCECINESLAFSTFLIKRVFVCGEKRDRMLC